MRTTLLFFLLIAAGCESYETRVYDVSVKNDSAGPITIWLTKNGAPFEPGWLAPEEIAIESPKQPEKIIGGVVVPQGKTADTGPRQGRFLSDTRAIFVGNASACQRKISNRHIIAEYHKYPLSHACLIRNDDAGADTLDYKIVGAPNSAVNVCVC